MYQFVVTMVYFTIVGLFVECWLSLRKWSSRLHSYLFFSCVANLIYNVGFLLELRATDQESYVMALKFGYFGRIWIGLALFLFVMELCRIRIPTAVTAVLTLIHAFMYYLILNIETNDLYYNYMEFVMVGDFPKLIHTGGALYHVQTGLMIAYSLIGIGVVVYTFLHEKYVIAKKRYLMTTFAMFSITLAYLIYVFKLIPLANVFDVTIFGFAIGTFFMIIAIFKYKMLDAESLARKYIADELTEAIIGVDSDGKVTYWNRPADRLFPELEKGSFLGRETKSVIERIRFAIYCEEPIRMNGRVYSPKANALMQDGITIGTLYVLVDETEHYGYMEELKKQKQIADEANKAKSKFLANMSHEIRTPINAILGLDEMVLRESGEKEIVEYARDIRSSGRTLLALINDILDFSKVEEGKMEILPVQYEPVTLKNDLVSMIKERAAEKDLELKVDFDRNIPRLLKGDEIRIKQCVLNLLTNAVKYTSKGSITLSIGFRMDGDDHLILTFSVKDTGIGIKPENMGDLFSPFMRIDEKKNRSIEGTGLGISITKKLLELMGSDLDVKSEYGKGSEFSFGVRQEILDHSPVGDYASKFDPGEVKEKAYRELFHAPDAKILVVDDIRMNLTVITKLLRKNGMQIDTARSGREAIDMAKEKEYDIIFIDHLMPEMDGIETLHRLKEQENGHSPVYVVLTANAVSGAREMYLEEGFADYISKPVEGEKLERLIMGYLPAEKLLDTPESV